MLVPCSRCATVIVLAQAMARPAVENGSAQSKRPKRRVAFTSLSTMPPQTARSAPAGTTGAVAERANVDSFGLGGGAAPAPGPARRLGAVRLAPDPAGRGALPPIRWAPGELPGSSTGASARPAPAPEAAGRAAIFDDLPHV